MKTLILLFLASALPAMAGLHFDQPDQKLDLPPDANSVEARFTFKNDGSDAVTIASYNASCSCIKTEVEGNKMTYAPGESGAVKVSYNMENFTGTVDKALAIFLKGDSSEKPSHVLTAHITIPVLVQIEPKTIIWEMGKEATVKTATLTMNSNEPIHVLNVSSGGKDFDYELKTVQDGKIARHRNQSVFAQVRKVTAP
jgi:Protein of unknown function (DUF1573)